MHFMAAIITGLAETSRHRVGPDLYKAWAKQAYSMADSMIEARSEKE